MATVLSVSPQGRQDGDGSEDRFDYLVVFDEAATATGADALEADDGTTRIPADNELIGTQRVSDKTYRRDSDNPNFFIVSVTLSSGEPEESDGDKRGVQVSVSDSVVDEVVYYDKDNKPIVNTAGQPFTNQP